MNIKKTLTTILLTAALYGPSKAQEVTSLSATPYHDTRTGLMGNISATANLPSGIDIFSFVDIFSASKQVYGEVTTTKKLVKGIGITANYNASFNEGILDDLVRFGATIHLPAYSKKIPIGVRILPISTRGVGQMVLYGAKNFGKHNVGGFADFNYEKFGGKPTVVSEVEYRQSISNKWSFAIEGRYNGFRDKHRGSVGIGFRYNFK